MYFSEYFNINRQSIEDYGAIDINLICDLPLFIDPMLIFNSSKQEYVDLHNAIIHYFHFLAKKSEQGLNTGDITTFFNFSEIKNNWFGYSKTGNEGNGNGEKFAHFFAKNIKFALQNHKISSGIHFEKALLLFQGNGKDKLSDLTTHLILDYLATYTQNFAAANINERFLDVFYLESRFNYRTETFESIEYKLPYIINKKGLPEYVILTPKDILRKAEPTINRLDLYRNYGKIRDSVDNASLRSQLDNYIHKAVATYEKECKEKKKKFNDVIAARIEKEAFIEALDDFPELYDYYIRLKESEKDLVNRKALNETLEQIEKFYTNSTEFIKLLKEKFPNEIISMSAREEARKRLIYFKHIIEHCDGYKNLYYQGQPISKEDDLQRLFRFVWHGSFYDVNYEANNGRGEADVKVSYGSEAINIIEFKLASNSKLFHIFEQTLIYEQANQSSDSLYAIFYFSEEEKNKINNILKQTKKEKQIGDSIFLIDCRWNNKKSASLADARPLE